MQEGGEGPSKRKDFQRTCIYLDKSKPKDVGLLFLQKHKGV